MRVLKAAGLALAAAATMAACGGGGGDTNPPPAQGTLTFSGTAAKGAALSGAAVTLKCAAGTPNPIATTTSSAGAYTAAIPGASLPCVVRVVGTEGSTFHAMVPGSATTGAFVANLTPLSEMMLAKAAGGSPAAYYAAFGSSNTLTAATVTTALGYVRTAVAPLTNLSTDNPLTDPLVVGNALDQKIDALVAGLSAAGVTLQQVVTAIVANPEAPTVVATPIAPAAAACSWLRSGNYRMISPAETEARWRTHVLTVNAATLTFTDQDGTPGTLTPLTSAGACRYTINDSDATHTVMVTSAGALVVHSQSTTSTQRAVTIGVPSQAVPIGEFSGAWNVVNWDPTVAGQSGESMAMTGTLTLDATGQITAVSLCDGLAPCQTATGPFPRFTANAAGGFDMIENGVAAARVFLFKNLAGRASLLFVDNEGSWMIGNRGTALTLPAVGDVSAFDQFTVNGDNSVTPLTNDINTITAVDSTARTVTRIAASNSRVDTLTYNSPRDGLRHRVANSCTINGAPSNCAQVVQMPVLGVTLSSSVGAIPATQFMTVSVGRPN